MVLGDRKIADLKKKEKEFLEEFDFWADCRALILQAREMLNDTKDLSKILPKSRQQLLDRINEFSKALSGDDKDLIVEKKANLDDAISRYFTKVNTEYKKQGATAASKKLIGKHNEYVETSEAAKLALQAQLELAEKGHRRALRIAGNLRGKNIQLGGDLEYAQAVAFEEHAEGVAAKKDLADERGKRKTAELTILEKEGEIIRLVAEKEIFEKKLSNMEKKAKEDADYLWGRIVELLGKMKKSGKANATKIAEYRKEIATWQAKYGKYFQKSTDLFAEVVKQKGRAEKAERELEETKVVLGATERSLRTQTQQTGAVTRAYRVQGKKLEATKENLTVQQGKTEQAEKRAVQGDLLRTLQSHQISQQGKQISILEAGIKERDEELGEYEKVAIEATETIAKLREAAKKAKTSGTVTAEEYAELKRKIEELSSVKEELEAANEYKDIQLILAKNTTNPEYVSTVKALEAGTKKLTAELDTLAEKLKIAEGGKKEAEKKAAEARESEERVKKNLEAMGAKVTGLEEEVALKDKTIIEQVEKLGRQDSIIEGLSWSLYQMEKEKGYMEDELNAYKEGEAYMQGELRALGVKVGNAEDKLTDILTKVEIKNNNRDIGRDMENLQNLATEIYAHVLYTKGLKNSEKYEDAVSYLEGELDTCAGIIYKDLTASQIREVRKLLEENYKATKSSLPKFGDVRLEAQLEKMKNDGSSILISR